MVSEFEKEMDVIRHDDHVVKVSVAVSS